ncbi:MAG: Ni/Fe hydrogenase subunit alpha [Phycisphaerae bacterium]|nr:MAG: Ni/Fe hydrogenase subunit alpha [Phycisphaerae bacterium]
MSVKPSKTIERTIHVENLARVEGEGALYIKAVGDEITDVRLDIFEPPRFYEAFLRGRGYREVPDITARICGICPVAYQMSSCHALEQSQGVTVGEPLRSLRRLLYCGEWIESHVLHMFMLHLPDFLGYESVVTLAADHKDVVAKALALKKAGNAIVDFIGGREVHPINVRVGGFYRLPSNAKAKALRETLLANRDFAVETIRFMAGLDFPDFEQDYEFVAMKHPNEYPFCEGRIVSSSGIDIPVEAFLNEFEEIHVKHSTALHGRLKDGRTYLVGPLARVNLNFDQLPDSVKQMADEIGFKVPCRNNFKSIIARALETLFAVDEAIAILENYDDTPAPHIQITDKAGIGHGCSEAPRGILYHRYEVDDGGLIKNAVITPPTAQNQPQIEDDLRHFFPTVLDKPEEEATIRCEQLIRNYDPCISCSTHFLKLNLDRT